MANIDENEFTNILTDFDKFTNLLDDPKWQNNKNKSPKEQEEYDKLLIQRNAVYIARTKLTIDSIKVILEQQQQNADSFIKGIQELEDGLKEANSNAEAVEKVDKFLNLFSFSNKQ